ncbi:anti-sigma factor family protein [Herbidospora sp. RD11066]
MTGDTHYDLEILAELAEGLLDDVTALEVRSHLAICDACGESLAGLAAVRELLSAVPVTAMPLGVAMRIDRALEAEAQRGGLRLVEEPNWDELMKDSPWEQPAEPVVKPISEPVVEPLVVPLAPAAARRKKSRRAWAMPITAAAAAAVVFGGVGLATQLVASGTGDGGVVQTQAGPAVSPERTPQKTAESAWAVRASGHNYTSRELNGPLLGYFGPEPGTGSNSDEQTDKCVARKANELDRQPIAVDRAFYNGQDATIMAFWEDKTINAVRVVVVGSNCHNLRPEGLATWN